MSFIAPLPLRRQGTLTKVGVREAERIAEIAAQRIRIETRLQGPVSTEKLIKLAKEAIRNCVPLCQITQFIVGRVTAGGLEIER